jgi:hypothetical protein
MDADQLQNRQQSLQLEVWVEILEKFYTLVKYSYRID